MKNGDGVLFECPQCHRLVVTKSLNPIPTCAGVVTNTIRDGHLPDSMQPISRVPASIVDMNIDYGMLAYDIGEAFAKTADEHGIDLGDRAIAWNLPKFIAACLTIEEEHDAKDITTTGLPPGRYIVQYNDRRIGEIRVTGWLGHDSAELAKILKRLNVTPREGDALAYIRVPDESGR